MTYRKNKKKCIFYPEERAKQIWDTIISLLLLTTCIYTPVMIAFNMSSSVDDRDWLSSFIDIMFLIDMIFTFFTANYNKDMDLVDDKRIIAKNYLTGWFLIDFISIVPLDLILHAEGLNRIIRVSKIGKLYKIMRLSKLVKFFALIQEKN
jgi:hypothetical protein